MPHASRATPTRCFSARETEVLARLAQGRKTRAIAGELHLSMKTVEAYYGHLRQALGVKSVNELLVFAVYHAMYHH